MQNTTNKSDHSSRTGRLQYALFLLLAFLIINPAQAAWTVVDSFTGGDVTTLVQDSAGNMYAATDGGGVFKSTDAAVSWSSTGSFTSASKTYSLFIDSSDNIFAGIADFSAIQKSTGGGANWAESGSASQF